MTNWDEIVFERAYSLILFKKSALLAVILRHFTGKQHQILPTRLIKIPAYLFIPAYNCLLESSEYKNWGVAFWKIRCCSFRNNFNTLWINRVYCWNSISHQAKPATFSIGVIRILEQFQCRLLLEPEFRLEKVADDIFWVQYFKVFSRNSSGSLRIPVRILDC